LNSGIIYFDNAATSWPKPPQVIRGVTNALKNKSGNPGRGSHKLSRAASELLYDCRVALGELFGAEAENVVFTSNATQALNYSIKGLVRQGCNILFDNYVHNAVFRPITDLVNKGLCTADMYDASGSTEETLRNINKLIKKETTIIVATHQSNICSKILPIYEMGKLCRREGIYFIVDASQSAGHIPIDVHKMNITSLCMPGHKGLLGPMGTGVLISGYGIKYNTIIEGGSGIHSLDSDMPDMLPERLEAGTLAVPSIAGLYEGIKYLNDYGLYSVHENEYMLSSYFISKIKKFSDFILYGEFDGNVISFNKKGYTPAEVGSFLASKGICVRTGYHCAPVAHKTIGSIENGTVRISFSHLNIPREVDFLVNTLSEL